MTELEAIESIKYRIQTASEIVGKGEDGKTFEDLEMAIKALEEQWISKRKITKNKIITSKDKLFQDRLDELRNGCFEYSNKDFGLRKVNPNL